MTTPLTVGGLVGALFWNSSDTLTINDCYTSGNLTATTSGVGAITGSATVVSGTGTLNANRFYSSSILSGGVNPFTGAVGGAYSPTYTNSYWIKDTGINAGTTSDGNQRTVAQLQTQATYNTWDFATVWNSPSSSYPTLR